MTVGHHEMNYVLFCPILTIKLQDSCTYCQHNSSPFLQEFKPKSRPLINDLSVYHTTQVVGSSSNSNHSAVAANF